MKTKNSFSATFERIAGCVCRSMSYRTTLMCLFLITVFCFPASTASAQKRKTQKTLANVDVPAQFPGGVEAMMQFISKEIKYPADAMEKKIGGRVVVSFVVDVDGSIHDVKVIRPVFPSLDAEAIRTIKAMPKWKPGEQNGKPVRTKMAVPISFRVQ